MTQPDFPRGGEPDRLFPGDSEMAGRMRAFDWSVTALGPPAEWPEHLRVALRLCLTSRFPILVWWGPDFTVLYNDAYIPFLGPAKHPRSLGRPGREVWAEIWDTIGPMLEGVRATGRATWSDEFQFHFARAAPREEVYVRFTYGPILAADGRTVDGVFCPCTETTGQVVGARRLETLRQLGVEAAVARTARDACAAAARVLAGNPRDVPFAAVYLADEPGPGWALVATAGLPDGHPLPRAGPGDAEPTWPLTRVLRTGRAEEAGGLAGLDPPLPAGPWPEPPDRAIILPISPLNHDAPAGLLVAGVSPRRPWDDAYRGFLDLVAGHVGTALAAARAHEAERRRAEALAELDRAKTAFFASVSHEFRTPLTLMLGPVEDLLSDAGGLTSANREHLELVRRNGLRLQKLVNNLLDFVRIEAGRAEARYAPTDLAALTADLASTFRSACERAGLDLVIDCPPLPEPVYVDRDLWEKVVLNLLSNAFKFTPAGRIEVRLAARGRQAVTTVRDTGVGIPADELSRVFDRFHRVEGTRGRTHEGSGIRLALVRELTRLHAGDVRAESVPGAGSTFTVSLPLGAGHLPADRVGPPRPSTPPAAEAFVEEALRLLPGPPLPAGDGASGRPRVLLADDNADMRGYVGRLLAGAYEVTAVADGEAALAAARARPPDLVLADVMMPRLDGFGLLRALRADTATRAVPVVLLSARAGEESRVEGLAVGADDYLVKPFAARELLARVAAHLEVARVRRDAERRVTGILDSIADGFVALDRDWRYTYINAAADAIHGVPRAALLGRRVWDAFPSTIGTPFERMCRQAAESGAAVEFDSFYAPHGRWYAIRAFPSADGLSVYFRDVTDRKQVEEALRRSEAQLSEAQELAHVGSWSWDLTTETLAWSDEHYRIVGLRPQQFPMTSDRGLGYIHPDDHPWVEDTVRRAMADGHPYECRFRIRRDDGTVRIVHSRGRAVYDESGRPVRMFGTIQDVTERVQAEADRERLALLVEHSTDFIGLCDVRGRPFFANPAALRLVGLASVDDVLRTTIQDYFFPEDQAFVTEEYMPRLLREGQARVEIRFRHFVTGEPIWMIFSSFTVTAPDGTLVGLATVSRDVTDERRAREALAGSEARLAAELAAVSGLHALAGRLLTAPDAAAALDAVVAAAVALHGSDMGTAQVWDQAAGVLRFAAARGFEPAALAALPPIPPDDPSTCAAVVRTGRRVVVEDFEADPAFAAHRGTAAALGYRAAHSTPLTTRRGELLGVFTTQYRSPHRPADRELRLTDLLARQAADWLERARAEEGVRRARDELEERVAARTTELAAANDALLGEAREREQAEAARNDLLRRLATAQEDERRRVARDLHDQVGQQLTALTLGLQAARDRGADAAPLAGLQRTAEQVARGVHDVALRLRPTALDDFGLAEALKSAAEEWRRAGGAAVALDTDGLGAGRLPPEVETALYRVVQEAVHNALKHARARRVSVLVERHHDRVTAIVEDDGSGFDTEAALAHPPTGRLGLVGMRERLSLVGGTLEVESALGAGTTVFARVPLPEGGFP
jgi:PAS domain S-box-containing protein